MNFKDRYPEYASIEDRIREAHAERSVAIGEMIADTLVGIARLFKRFIHESPGAAAERERSAIAADPFLKRSVSAPHR